MREILIRIVEWIAIVHNKIMELNDSYEYDLSDKDLHFIVIGVVGLLIVFIVYPFFKWLAKHKHIMVITWIYVLTLIIGITFAIEIGQKFTGTGVMDFGDIGFGIVGFAVFFLVFAIVRELYHLLVAMIKKLKKKGKKHE